jgi:hypothetical protein
VLGIIALMYVGAPLLLYFTFRQRCYGTLILIAPEQVPHRAAQFFVDVSPALAAEGFQVDGYLQSSGSVAGVGAFVASWSNLQRGQRAGAIAVISATGTMSASLTFETTVAGPEFVNVTTCNVRGNAGVYDATPSREKAYLPWVRDPRVLYEAHLARERRLVPRGATRYVPEYTDILATAELEQVAELREQTRTGLMQETETVGVFRPTFIGAWRMVYRLLPPLKQVRVWRAKQRGRADEADAMKSPAPRPNNVRVTRVSPYAQPVGQHPLTYA